MGEVLSLFHVIIGFKDVLIIVRLRPIEKLLSNVRGRIVRLTKPRGWSKSSNLRRSQPDFTQAQKWISQLMVEKGFLLTKTTTFEKFEFLILANRMFSHLSRRWSKIFMTQKLKIAS